MWKQELNNSICDIEGLSKTFNLSKDKKEVFSTIIEKYPMRINPYYFSLIDIDNPNDPIAKMCIPSENELERDGEFDTSGEIRNTKSKGIQHKYTHTALVLSSNVCAMYCRYCFRKRMVGLTDNELIKQVDEAVEYVRNHTQITNVLITGGDALMNSNSIIELYLRGFSQIDSLDFIRFGTRVPVTIPSRINEDMELLDILECYAKKKSIYIVTQFNHPREVTKEAILAVRSLQKKGIQVRNQTVLLKGVNDTPQVLGDLLRELTKIRVVPYYIFQCRPVIGVKNQFQVPLLKAYKIVEQAKEMQNGIGKNVRFCMSHPLGKIEILGELANNQMLFKFHENKDKENASRLFFAELQNDSTWLDEQLCAQ